MKKLNTKAGNIYQVSDPEFVGQMPIKQEIEVLAADNAEQEKLGWTVNITSGPEIFLQKISNGHLTWDEELLTSKDAIKVGDTVMVMHITGGRFPMEVKMDKYGELYGESEHSIGDFQFGEDSRNCWTCPAIINKKCLDKIKKD